MARSTQSTPKATKFVHRTYTITETPNNNTVVSVHYRFRPISRPTTLVVCSSSRDGSIDTINPQGNKVCTPYIHYCRHPNNNTVVSVHYRFRTPTHNTRCKSPHPFYCSSSRDGSVNNQPPRYRFITDSQHPLYVAPHVIVHRPEMARLT